MRGVAGSIGMVREKHFVGETFRRIDRYGARVRFFGCQNSTRQPPRVSSVSFRGISTTRPTAAGERSRAGGKSERGEREERGGERGEGARDGVAEAEAIEGEVFQSGPIRSVISLDLAPRLWISHHLQSPCRGSRWFFLKEAILVGVPRRAASSAVYWMEKAVLSYWPPCVAQKKPEVPHACRAAERWHVLSGNTNRAGTLELTTGYCYFCE